MRKKTAVKTATASELTAQQEKWLAEKEIKDYTVNKKTGNIDIKGSVEIDGLKDKKLPVKFGKVQDYFLACGGDLESLEGSPTEVGEDYMVNHNCLTSMVGSPEKVGDAVSYAANDIESFEGCVKHIGSTLRLDEMPKLKSLHDIHRHVKYIGNDIVLNGTKLESCVLGVLLIEGLKTVTMDSSQSKIGEIINKHLQSEERDLLACQNELIEAGFEPFARL